MINVIIPAYNCSATLDRTLSSLVAQTDTEFEVIIVDDCSTEDIKPIIDDYNKKLQIIYIRNKKNMGCGMSRQVGIDNATQKFITFLDSDDMFMPYTVGTFNAAIKVMPNLEYLHTHFYEEIEIDNSLALCLRKDNFTACHGKLYNVEKIKEFGIRNSPEIKWADDSYFNSICGELLDLRVLDIPTVLWTNNKNSVLRCNNEKRDKEERMDFLNAMTLSAKFVLQYKSQIGHMKKTLEHISQNGSLTAEERVKFEQLFKYIKEK